MIKKKQLLFFVILYVCLVLVEVCAIVLSSKLLEQLIKPMFLVLLLLMYIKLSVKPNKWFVIALFLYALGDYIFIFNNNEFSLHVSTVFLTVAFIGYAILVFKEQPKQSESILFSVFIAFFLSAGLIFYLLSERIEGFFFVAFFHTVVISVLVVAAISSYLHANTRQNLILLIGAFLFVISDCLFVIDRYYNDTILYSIIIINFYAFGQLAMCIFMSAIAQKELLHYK